MKDEVKFTLLMQGVLNNLSDRYNEQATIVFYTGTAGNPAPSFRRIIQIRGERLVMKLSAALADMTLLADPKTRAAWPLSIDVSFPAEKIALPDL